MSAALKARLERCRSELADRNQLHLLLAWDALDEAARDELLDEIESLPWEQLDPVLHSLVRRGAEPQTLAELEPAAAYPLVPTEEHRDLYRDATALGRQLIAEGRVAAFTVAGGQGSRLGFDGPKGALPISPIRKKTLFQLFAEMLVAARERYSVEVPWYVMTNPANHQQTLAFLRHHDNFGVAEDSLFPFVQDMLPVFDFEGRILMKDTSHLALAPSGHGGSLASLARSGALANMRGRGVEIISYFQVDNPLIRPLDPLFIGLHRLQGSEMSSKVTAKTDDLERVGNLCMSDGQLAVVEYSDFPEELARARSAQGARKFDLGNLAIHLLDVAFVERIASTRLELPFHRAEKKVAWTDSEGVAHDPATPNAIKLEAFIFDALPLAANPLLLTVDRSEEFSPVKNAKGADSIESATRDQIRRAARWLESAGVQVPRNGSGEPALTIEMAPGFASEAADVGGGISEELELSPGDELYLA